MTIPPPPHMVALRSPQFQLLALEAEGPRDDPRAEFHRQQNIRRLRELLGNGVYSAMEMGGPTVDAPVRDLERAPVKAAGMGISMLMMLALGYVLFVR